MKLGSATREYVAYKQGIGMVFEMLFGDGPKGIQAQSPKCPGGHG
jgi:hypothetical protein